MNPRPKNMLKIAILAGFIALNVAFGTARVLDSSPPARWNGDPYAVGVREIVIYGEDLEGQSIQVIGEAVNVSHDQEADSMVFNVSDGYFGLSVVFVFDNWSAIEGAGSGEIRNGTALTIKGICMYHSTGVVRGTAVQVLNEDRSYVLSIVTLVFLLVAILVYFKVDLRHLSLVLKPGKQRRSPHRAGENGAEGSK